VGAAKLGTRLRLLPLMAMALNANNAIVFNVYPAAATNIRAEMGLSGSQTGLLASAFTLGYASIQIAGGFLSVKYGRRQVLLVAILSTGASTLLFAAVSGYYWLLLARFLMGFSVGAMFPTVNHLFSEHFSGSRLRSNLAFYTAGYGTGTVFTFLVLSLLINSGGWRSMVVAAAAINGLTAICAALLLRGEVFHRSALPSEAAWNRGDFVRLFGNPDLLCLGLIYTCVVSGGTVVLTWTPVLLHERFPSGAIGANLLTSFVGVSMVVACLLGSRLAARFDWRYVLLSSALAGLLLPSLIALAPTPLLTLVVLGVVTWFNNYSVPTLFSLFPRFIPKELLGIGAGGLNTMAFVASFITPALFGVVLDASGSFAFGFATTSLLAFLGLGGFVYLVRGPKNRLADLCTEARKTFP
jgi:MFS family permease